MNRCKERLLEFVVSGGDSSEFFHFSDQSLDHIAFAIRFFVEPTRVFAVRSIWDHGLRPVFPARLALRLAVEAFVANEFVDLRHTPLRFIQHWFEVRSIVFLARNDIHGNCSVFVCHCYQDLAGMPASAPAKTFFLCAPFFAPAAWRCARMMVESMKTRLTSSKAGLAVRSLNSLFKLPLICQRRNRLYTASHAPNSLGKSRQGIPVCPQYNRASKNSRSDSWGGCPPLYRLACLTSGSMAFQSSSVNMYRMTSVSPGRIRLPSVCLNPYHTAARNVNRT